MARPIKAGLEYAGWKVDLFDGVRGIDQLLDKMGCAGFTVYFYLCQRAYGLYGYYFPYTHEDACGIARRIGAGVRGDDVKKTVDICLQCGLFDADLFAKHGVLTNGEIQMNFAAVKGNRMGRYIQKELWLEGFEGQNAGFAQQNGGFAAENEGLADKESRVEESKGEESKAEQSKPAITREKMVFQYGESKVREYLKRAGEYYRNPQRRLEAAAEWLQADAPPLSEEQREYEQRLLTHIPVYKKRGGIKT